MTTHTVKIWPRYFESINSGDQNFDIRQDDRNYQVGDALILEEYRPKVGEYTGRQIKRVISFIHRSGGAPVDDPVAHVIMPGYCILALRKFSEDW
jgi:hypothetical protein